MATKPKKRGWRARILALVVLLGGCGPAASGGHGDDPSGVDPASAAEGMSGDSPRLAARELQAAPEYEQLVAPPKEGPVRLERSITAPPKPIWEWKGPDTRAVAIQGEVAPGTGGLTFDQQVEQGSGFGQPVVNERGDVAFVASFGRTDMLAAPKDSPVREAEPGAGVFFWDRSEDRLSPVVLPGQDVDGEDVLSPDNFLNSFRGPQINDRNQISVSVVNRVQEELQPIVVKKIPHSVLLQFTPNDDRCETFSGKIIAQTDDPVPGGGLFLDLLDNSENERGDIAFQATITNPSVAAAEVAPEMPVGRQGAIFLYKAHTQELLPVVREHDPLPGTNGGRFCSNPQAPRGPWLNDDGVVMFIADCVEDSNGAPLPDYEGSAFLWTEAHGLRLFFKNHSEIRVKDECDSCGELRTVHRIETGFPGLSEDRAVFAFVTNEGMSEFSLVGTKKLSEDADDRRVDICARDDQELPNGDSILLGRDPTISSDNILSFGALERGWVGNAPSERFGAFTCYQQQLHLIVDEGDPMPVGECNTFGGLSNESNSDRYIVFLNLFKPPAGVFTANSNPQLP